MLEGVVERLKRGEGAQHPRTLVAMNSLAFGSEKAGRAADAIPVHAETWQLRQTRLGADHPDTLVSLSNLAYCDMQNEQFAESVEHYAMAVSGLTQKLGEDSDETLGCMNNFGLALISNKDDRQAATVFATSVKFQREKYRRTGRRFEHRFGWAARCLSSRSMPRPSQICRREMRG